MSYLDLEHKKIKTAPKIILEESKFLNEKVYETVKKIATVVGSTLGPNGKTVLIERFESGLMPFQSKDGVTVARALAFSDPVKQTILETFREAAIKTVEFAGDGTTTATVLAFSILKNISLFLKKNKKYSPQVCIKEIQSFFNETCLPLIESKTTKINIENKNDFLFKVASLSSNGDFELAKKILEAFELVGDEGHITLSESNGPHGYEISKTEGFPIHKGYEEVLGRFSNEFLNDASQSRIFLEKPFVILYDGKLLDIAILTKFLELFEQDIIQGKYSTVSFVVFAHEFSKEFIGYLAQIFKKTQIKVICCTTPNDVVANSRTEFLKDISAFTGGKIFNPLTEVLSNGVQTDLGKAVDGFEMLRFRSCLLGDGNQESVISRVNDLKNRIKHSSSKVDEMDLNVRIGKISGGIAKLTVRDISDSQIRETKDRAEDAICAIRGAITKGILPGGCRILLDLSLKAAEDKKESIKEILQPSFFEPFTWLLKNCGLNEDEMKKIILTLLDNKNIVYDALNSEFGNAFDLGILDSQPAVVEAIRSAISISSLLGTLGGIIVFGRDEDLERTKALECYYEEDKMKQVEKEKEKEYEDLKYDINTY